MASRDVLLIYHTEQESLKVVTNTTLDILVLEIVAEDVCASISLGPRELIVLREWLK